MVIYNIFFNHCKIIVLGLKKLTLLPKKDTDKDVRLMMQRISDRNNISPGLGFCISKQQKKKKQHTGHANMRDSCVIWHVISYILSTTCYKINANFILIITFNVNLSSYK